MLTFRFNKVQPEGDNWRWQYSWRAQKPKKLFTTFLSKISRREWRKWPQCRPDCALLFTMHIWFIGITLFYWLAGSQYHSAVNKKGAISSTCIGVGYWLKHGMTNQRFNRLHCRVVRIGAWNALFMADNKTAFGETVEKTTETSNRISYNDN